MCGHIPHDVIGGVHDQMCPQNQIMHQLGGDHCPPNSIFESGALLSDLMRRGIPCFMHKTDNFILPNDERELPGT